ncbi:hypothetical protein HNY73_022425 [Argiope bruennichi]|uniref:Uncharacterized protein n=1 Tax=Argiope bruennichi TaxID=94029 RepID=A0A8T0E526_ARGBR|nr:hypothetical protein HNY73_022425 [Argiope bruennichi]
MDASHQERMRNMLAEFDAIDEVRQTYLNSYEIFRNYFTLKEQRRKSLTKKANYSLLKDIIRLFFLERRGDNETLRSAQMILVPMNVENNSSSGLFGQECVLSQKDGGSKSITETDLPFGIEMYPFFERNLKMFEYNIGMIGSFFEDHEFHNGSKDVYEEVERKGKGTEKSTSEPSNDQDKSFFKNSHKDGVSERASVKELPQELFIERITNDIEELFVEFIA